MRVIYKLFESSWRHDAVLLSRGTGVYTDPARVREINHKGLFFDVPGPHLCQPSPQRTPLLMQAGASSKGKAFAAQHAEAVFMSAHAPEVCRKSVAEIRAMARDTYGRDPANIKLLGLVTPILGRTEEEAQAKLEEEYTRYASHEGALALFGGWTGIDLHHYGEEKELRHVESNAVRSTVDAYARFPPGTGKWTKGTVARHVAIGGNGPVLVGTARQVADELETRVEEADVDGVNIAYVLFPGSFEGVVEMLLPESMARGLFWEDYEVQGETYRKNFYRREGQTGPLGEHVAAQYRWRAGVGREEHRSPDS
jgi:FMN-dependent oxidoreductase (nitrilotriacetate monooxygenase family)